MKRLFDAAGVDYRQWRALMRAYTLTDFAALLGAHGPAQAWQAAAALALRIVFYAILGAGPAMVILVAHDTLLGAVAMSTMMIWLVGTILLAQTVSIILPDDYAIVGFRPVSSRTYVAVRLGALLLPAVEASVLAGLLPVAAFLSRAGGSWPLALAAVAANLGAALAITFGLVVLCASLLRVVRPARLQRAVLYTQTVAGLVVSFVYLAVWMTFVVGGRDAIGSLADRAFPRGAWVLLYPGTWFGAWIEIAAGRGGALDIAAGSLALLALAALAVMLRGRLSTDYAVRVAHLTADAPSAPARPPRHWSLLRGERRAMFVLLRSMLRGDLAVQTHILAMLVTGIVLTGAMNYNEGWPADPFLTESRGFSQFALFILPLSLKDALMTSAEYQASWLFFASPIDRGKLVAAGRDAVALCVLTPAVLLAAGFYIYSFGHVGHALTHAAVAGLAAYIALQIGVAINPTLPFSRPVGQPRRGFQFVMLTTMPVMFAGVTVAELFRVGFYGGPWLVAGGLALLGLVIAALNRLGARRIAARAAGLAYEG